MKKLLIFSVLLNLVFSQGYDSLFKEGNSNYKSENFVQAIFNYEKILEHVEHENIYYNLGNAYYRNGDIGNSIWALEKAYILDPRDSDINFNLKYLRSMVMDRIIPPDDLYILSLYKKTIEKLRLIDLLGIVGFFLLLFSIRFAMHYFSYISKRINSILSYLLMVTIFTSSWMAFDKYWSISDNSYAIVLSTAIDVRSAPIMRGENVVFRIHEGTKVEIQDTQIGWSEIILLDGKKGWIPSKQLREI
ncbi:MAG: hypothetical protein CMG45_00470 [Candidatus Marinimicrobia bacterium]|nr:hypothetical protein [Candidatus Neomarinimicrobiota bacterium]